MSCPICGELCRCAEPRAFASRSLTLAEIDDYDPSEEQFASSLAGRETIKVASDEEGQELSSGSLASARQRYARQLPDVAVEVPQPDLPLTSTPAPGETWREEVSSRIQNYKARRRRSLGEQSLSFNFESTAGNHVFLRPEVEPEPEPPVSSESVEPVGNYFAHPYATAPAIAPEYTAAEERMDDQQADISQTIFAPEAPAPAPVPETAKLIFFPKPPMMQEAPSNTLADPVFDVPRIVEAPDAVEPVTVPLADITLQPNADDDGCVPYIEPFHDLPLPVASVQQRVFAELTDGLLVMVATAAFLFVVSRLAGTGILGDKRTLAAVLVLIPAMLWAMFKYIFLVHGGTTPGMRLAQLRIIDFDGSIPASALRRYRALAMMLSAFPLGLGLLWSFVDTETLCWHDRISKTYVTGKQ